MRHQQVWKFEAEHKHLRRQSEKQPAAGKQGQLVTYSQEDEPPPPAVNQMQ